MLYNYDAYEQDVDYSSDIDESLTILNSFEYSCGYDSDHVSDLEDLENSLYSQLHYSAIECDADSKGIQEGQAKVEEGQQIMRRILCEVDDVVLDEKDEGPIEIVIENSNENKSVIDNNKTGLLNSQRETKNSEEIKEYGDVFAVLDKNGNFPVGSDNREVVCMKEETCGMENNHSEEEYGCSKYALKSLKTESGKSVKDSPKRLKKKLKKSPVKCPLDKEALTHSLKNDSSVSFTPNADIKSKKRVKNKTKSKTKTLDEDNNQELAVDNVDLNCVNDSTENETLTKVSKSKSKHKNEYVNVSDDISDLDVIEIDSDESETTENTKKKSKVLEPDSDSDGSSVVLLGDETDPLLDNVVLGNISVNRGRRQLQSLPQENDNSDTEEYDVTPCQDDDREVWKVDPADRRAPLSRNPRYFIECRNCRQNGHVENRCPHKKKEPVCLVCGMRGHRMAHCPMSTCNVCRSPGRLHTTTCRRATIVCRRCRYSGHEARSCPDLWRRYHSTTETGPIQTPTKSHHQKQCCNCGTVQYNHLYHECKRRRMKNYDHITSSPLVISYDDYHSHTDNYITQQHTENEHHEPVKPAPSKNRDNLNQFASKFVKKKRNKKLNFHHNEEDLTKFQESMNSVDSIRNNRTTKRSAAFCDNVEQSTTKVKRHKNKLKIKTENGTKIITKRSKKKFDADSIQNVQTIVNTKVEKTTVNTKVDKTTVNAKVDRNTVNPKVNKTTVNAKVDQATVNRRVRTKNQNWQKYLSDINANNINPLKVKSKKRKQYNRMYAAMSQLDKVPDYLTDELMTNGHTYQQQSGTRGPKPFKVTHYNKTTRPMVQ